MRQLIGQRPAAGRSIQPNFLNGMAQWPSPASAPGNGKHPYEEAQMKPIKGIALTALALGILSTAGGDRHSNKEFYSLVSPNLTLPYWQTAAAGFNKAAGQYK